MAFPCLSNSTILTVRSLGPCVISVCLRNRRPSGTCYSAYCLQKNLRDRYFSLDMQLKGLVKEFQVLHQCIIRSVPSLIVLQEKTVKKPLVSCAGSPSTTIQEDHLCVQVVCFTPLYSTATPEIALRYPRTALWPKLSPRIIIVQLPMRGIQI